MFRLDYNKVQESWGLFFISVCDTMVFYNYFIYLVLLWFNIRVEIFKIKDSQSLVQQYSDRWYLSFRDIVKFLKSEGDILHWMIRFFIILHIINSRHWLYCSMRCIFLLTLSTSHFLFCLLVCCVTSCSRIICS